MDSSEVGYYDVYVLARERSDVIVRRFRDRWLNDLTEAAADYYRFPQFCDLPNAVVTNPGPGEDLLSAHLFFTSDGGLTGEEPPPYETTADFMARVPRAN